MENKLKEIRTKKKLSQRAVCDRCGLKFTQEYHKIEACGRVPHVNKAIKIARAFNMKVEDIWIVD